MIGMQYSQIFFRFASKCSKKLKNDNEFLMKWEENLPFGALARYW